MPYFLQQLFQCNFDLDLFKLNNEQYIRDEAIENYIYKSSPGLLTNEIDNMIYSLKMSFKIL